jgi:AraC-like DNA-binding protein
MISGYWRLDGLTPGRLYAAVPKRQVEFVINIGAPQLAGAQTLAGNTFKTCWITGCRDAPIYILPTGPCTLYGVRFRDFSAPAWLSGALRRDPSWSTDLGGAAPARHLTGLIADCNDLEGAAHVFNAFFLLRGSQEHVDPLAHAIGRCQEDNDLAPAAILERFDGPHRRARAKAQSHSGLTLRRFSRLARFDRALHRLGAGGNEKITGIALDVGYYDEAHMAHDFADFCGVSPGAYRRLRARAGNADLPHHMYGCE